jgi:hypothetical protein
MFQTVWFLARCLFVLLLSYLATSLLSYLATSLLSYLATLLQHTVIGFKMCYSTPVTVNVSRALIQRVMMQLSLKRRDKSDTSVVAVSVSEQCQSVSSVSQ